MDLPTGYIPKEKRKKILLLSDDLRLPSGVGVMSKELVVGTAHHYNWIQLGAGINHPELGKIMDASDSLSKELNIPDASLKIFPYNGYGDPGIIRQLMMMEQPDAIMHFTDPRYWQWLYQMESEIRENIPLFFYHVWDDLPFPKYNEHYYRSCDYIACISRQTYNIVKNVWVSEPKWEPWQIQYIPHGIDENIFKKLSSPEDLERVSIMKKNLLGDDEVDFVVLYNNRNIRRKMTGDVILAYKKFHNSLPKELANKCRLLLHTQAVDENGTDIPRVINDLAPEIKFAFSQNRIPPQDLNLIYNISDVTINLASNEGFGLATLESLAAETMIISNVTGGLQDQMGFVDDDGVLVNENDHFSSEWGSNHDGRYKKHGEWAVSVFPNNLALQGSPPTPYIFDDRCDWREAADKILEVYNMSKEERLRRGALGREYVLTKGFRKTDMCNKFIDGMDLSFQKWTPRERFGIYKT